MEYQGPTSSRPAVGIQVFVANGGAATEELNNAIYERTRYITKESVDTPSRTGLALLPTAASFLLPFQGTQEFFVEGRSFTIEVVDPVEEYLRLLETIFDFEVIRNWITKNPRRILIDVRGGAMGLYVERIFCEQLGLEHSCLLGGDKKTSIGTASVSETSIEEVCWDTLYMMVLKPQMVFLLFDLSKAG